MAILFAGGEAESFNVSGSTALGWTTSADFYDSTYSRGALGIRNDGICDVDLASGETDFWLHFGAAFDNVAFSYDDTFCYLIDTATGREVVRLFIDDGDNFYLKFQYWDGSAYQTVASDLAISEDTFYAIDVHCKIADSGGTFSVYVDKALEASFSGDTLRSDFTQIDRIRFRSPWHAAVPGRLWLSQVILADEDTREMVVVTLPVTGNGTNTAWDNDYQNVDEEGTYNDSDIIISDAADETETFTLGDTGLTGFDVLAVSVVARAKRDLTGPQNLRMAVRSGGTDYVSSNVNGFDVTYKSVWNVWSQNPDTSSAWTLSEVDALEAGVRSIT